MIDQELQHSLYYVKDIDVYKKLSESPLDYRERRLVHVLGAELLKYLLEHRDRMLIPIVSKGTMDIGNGFAADKIRVRFVELTVKKGVSS